MVGAMGTIGQRKVFMKTYRLKVDSPWGDKGEFYNESHVIIANCGGGPSTQIWQSIACKKLPDIFEEVIEQSDEGWLAGWLLKVWTSRDSDHGALKTLSQSLIQHGFDVKKLRDKQ